MRPDYDIVIIGAGLVGTALAMALSHLPLRIAMVERKPCVLNAEPNLNGKPMVLNYASCGILQSLMGWNNLSIYANPVEQIHISEANCFAAARIRAKQMGVSALGYVIPASVLEWGFTKSLLALSAGFKPLHLDLFHSAHCQTLLKQENGWQVYVITETGKLQIMSASLVVAADGSDSSTRQLLNIELKNQCAEQMALVSSIKLARHHDHTAYQRFTPQGVMAALPLLDNNMGFVCTATPSQIQKQQSLSTREFLQWVQSIFAYRLGQFLASGPIRTFPIRSFIAQPQAQAGFVLLGSAAHTLSPVAAQGFNLSMQDMAELADIVSKAFIAKKDLAGADISRAYLTARLPIQKRLIELTKNLPLLFRRKFGPLTLIRNSGLLAFDLIQPLKRNISRRFMGTYGRLAPLVRGVTSLQAEKNVKF